MVRSPAHEAGYRLFKAIQRQLEHRKHLPNNSDGVGVPPMMLGHRIQPHAMPEGLGKELQPLQAGPATSFKGVDGSVRHHQFVRGHACIPHQDKPCFRVILTNSSISTGFFLLWGLPEKIVHRVVEEKGFQILELGPGITEKRLHHIHVRLH